MNEERDVSSEYRIGWDFGDHSKELGLTFVVDAFKANAPIDT